MNVLDRKTAADMLQVSIRTIDRYIHKGDLEKEVINGRIFIKSKALKDLLEQKKLQQQYLDDIYSNSAKKEESPTTEKATEAVPEEPVAPIETHYTGKHREYDSEEGEDTGIYKRLYEELQEELKDQTRKTRRRKLPCRSTGGIFSKKGATARIPKSPRIGTTKTGRAGRHTHNLSKKTMND